MQEKEKMRKEAAAKIRETKMAMAQLAGEVALDLKPRFGTAVLA